MSTNWRGIFAAVSGTLMLLLTACGEDSPELKEKDRWSRAEYVASYLFPATVEIVKVYAPKRHYHRVESEYPLFCVKWDEQFFYVSGGGFSNNITEVGQCPKTGSTER